jgi:hypothetical protein
MAFCPFTEFRKIQLELELANSVIMVLSICHILKQRQRSKEIEIYLETLKNLMDQIKK